MHYFCFIFSGTLFYYLRLRSRSMEEGLTNCNFFSLVNTQVQF